MPGPRTWPRSTATSWSSRRSATASSGAPTTDREFLRRDRLPWRPVSTQDRSVQRAPVDPGGELVGGKLLHPGCVALDARVVDQLAPLTAGALVEEAGRIAPLVRGGAGRGRGRPG